MNANEIVQALREECEDYSEFSPTDKKCHGIYYCPTRYAVDLIESLQAQLAASQRRAQDARNELCLKCGQYREAHNGACDGCRWKENFKMLNAEKDRSYLLKHYGRNFPAHAKYVRKPNRIYFATDFDDGEKITFAWMCDQPSSNAHGNATYHSPAKGFRLLNIHDLMPDMEAECAGCENWSGSDCTLFAPDTGCPFSGPQAGKGEAE